MGWCQGLKYFLALYFGSFMSGSQRHLCYKEVIRLFWSLLTLLWKELMCGVLKDGPKCRTWDVNNNKKPFIEAKGAQVHRGRHNRHFNSRQREDGTIATFQIPRNSLLGRCVPEKRVVSQDWSCDFFCLLGKCVKHYTTKKLPAIPPCRKASLNCLWKAIATSKGLRERAFQCCKISV